MSRKQEYPTVGQTFTWVFFQRRVRGDWICRVWFNKVFWSVWSLKGHLLTIDKPNFTRWHNGHLEEIDCLITLYRLGENHWFFFPPSKMCGVLEKCHTRKNEFIDCLGKYDDKTLYCRKCAGDTVYSPYEGLHCFITDVPLFYLLDSRFRRKGEKLFGKSWHLLLILRVAEKIKTAGTSKLHEPIFNNLTDFFFYFFTRKNIFSASIRFE